MQPVKMSGMLLKTRITLITLGAILFGFGLLALHTILILRENMESQVGTQQATAAALIAAQVNAELSVRTSTLEQIAREIGGYSPDNGALSQKIVDQYFDPGGLFNAGLLIVQTDGSVVAGRSLLSANAEQKQPERELISRLVEQGKPQIGQVAINKASGFPLFGIAVPLRDKQARVTGALLGRVHLLPDDFMAQLMRGFDGSRDRYLLITPQSRMVFAANEQRWVGEKLPETGKNALLDNLFLGTPGSGAMLEILGQEYLTSVREVPLSGWYVLAMQPVAEALTPFFTLRQHLLLNTLLLTVLVSVLLWWLLQQQLRPLQEISGTLATMTAQNQPMCLLPTAHQDEIGRLIDSFNRLMDLLSYRENELRESESRYRMLFDEMLDAFVLYAVVTDGEGKPCNFRFLSVNSVFIQMTGQESEEKLIGRDLTDILSDDKNIWHVFLCRVALSGKPTSFEFFSERNRRNLEVKVFQPRPGQIACIVADITVRKQAEAALRRSEESFRNFFEKNSTVMLMVDPASGYIIEANAAAVSYYGYPESRLKSMPVSEINDMTTERIEAEGMRALSEEGDAYLLSHRLASGELRDVEVHLSPIETGGRTLLFSIVHDITERRKAEQKLALLAQIDTLTGLPNRRYFLEMAERELSGTLRHGGCLSVLMMDIDYFKKVNDTYGHHAGDLVLQTTGRLLQEALCEANFVGRLGGEEFAAVLPQADCRKAWELAEHLRQVIEAAETIREEGPALRVTLSIGISTLCGAGNINVDTLISQADKALYEAKRSGRNRVCVFKPL